MQPQQVVELSQFGASEGQDAATAFETAIASLHDGDTLVIDGNYTLASTVVIKKALTIRGGSLTLAAPSMVQAACDRVTFRDVTFTGNHVTLLKQGWVDFIGWQFANCTFVQVALHLDRPYWVNLNNVAQAGTVQADVTDCVFRDYIGAYTLAVAGWDGVTIRRVTIRNVGVSIAAGDGIKIHGAAINTLIEDALIEDAKKDSIDAYISTKTTIRRLISRRAGVVGVDFKRHQFLENRGHILEDSLIENGDITAINGNADDTIIRRNIVRGNQFGLLLHGTNQTVRDNDLLGNLSYDLRIEPDAINLNADVLTANEYDLLQDAR